MLGGLPSWNDHVLSARQFKEGSLETIFARTKLMESDPQDYSRALRGKVVAILFYEPSTRTRFSFESAVARLGGSVISTENAKEFSSAIKGETIEDTIRIVGGYADAIVIRHFDDDAAECAALVTEVPIINAGSGKREHPTQALLDVYTIWKKFGKLEGLRIVVAGDLARGRTANSLIYLLAQFPGNHFDLVAPASCEVAPEMKAHLKDRSASYTEYETLLPVLAKADIVYMTRIQKERFDDASAYEAAKETHSLSLAMASRMKKDAIIMHPLPRAGEISSEVDRDPRAYYFRQAQYGLYVRMALLSLLTKFSNS